MTKSELKSRLRRVNSLDYEFQVVEMKIERLESILGAHGIRYDVDRVQTSPTDAVAEVMAKIEPLIAERTRLTVAITKAIADTSDIIDHLKDDKQRLVMHYRYTAGLSFETIGRRMSYSSQRIYQLHDDAIRWLVDNLEPTKTRKIRVN